MRKQFARFARVACALALFAAAAVLAGCIEKEMDTSIVLQPDGSGTWTITDREVHARADTLADRLREEREFLASVEAGRYEEAKALEAIGCSEVRAELVRASWPYMVITSGRFADVGEAWQALLDRSGVPGRSHLERAADRVTWELRAEEGTEGTADGQEEVTSVLLGGNDIRYFIRHGRFVAAAGFTLSEDGRVATMKLNDESHKATDGTTRFSLTWTTE